MLSTAKSPADPHKIAATIYRSKYAYLLDIARRNAFNRPDAEEALQEAFAAFLAEFDPGHCAPPLAWLTLTMKRICWRKRDQRRLNLCAGQQADWERWSGELGFSLAAIATPRGDLEERVLRQDEARSRLAFLKPDERTALEMHAAGFSYREIAAQSGWTYTKVNRCISEGRAALRLTMSPSSTRPSAHVDACCLQPDRLVARCPVTRSATEES